MPSTKVVTMKPRKRLKKRKEMEVVVGNSRKLSYSFCNGIGCEIPNCHVRNSHKAKCDPELDTKVSKCELSSQIKHADINDLRDEHSGPTMSNLTKKQMTCHLMLDKTLLKHHHDRFNPRHHVKIDNVAVM